MKNLNPFFKMTTLAGLLLVTACGGGAPAKNTYHSGGQNNSSTTPMSEKDKAAKTDSSRTFMCTFSKKSVGSTEVSEQKDNISFKSGEAVAAKAYLEQADGKFEVEVKDGYLQISYLPSAVQSAEKSKPIQSRLALAKGHSLDLSVQSATIMVLASCADPEKTDPSNSLNVSKIDPVLSQTFQCSANSGDQKAESKSVSLKVLVETPEVKPADSNVNTEISKTEKTKMSVDADQYAGEISLVLVDSENGMTVKAKTSSGASSVELKSGNSNSAMQCKADAK